MAEAQDRARALRSAAALAPDAKSLKPELQRLRSSIEEANLQHSILSASLRSEQKEQQKQKLDEVSRLQQSLASHLDEFAFLLEQEKVPPKILRQKALRIERAVLEWKMSHEKLAAALSARPRHVPGSNPAG